MAALEPHLEAQVRRWIADDPDPLTAAEATTLLTTASLPDPQPAAAAAAELADRFSRLLTFGTAGLRGRLGAGPNRMNRAVVIRAAAGLVAYLKDHVRDPRIVIGYDARRRSADFARDTAAVVTAAGGTALLLPSPQPTPVLAFAVRHLAADAGVMVTASHNPASDNGYKVYLGGRVVTGAGQGAQLVPPADVAIAARMAAVRAVSGVPRAEVGWQVLDASVRTAYLDRLVAAAPHASGPVSASVFAPTPTPTSGLPYRPHPAPGRPGAIRIVLTAMHGVGGTLAFEALGRAGFTDIHQVPEQEEPDPDFPTVAFPNPEEPGALDLALELARRAGADLVLALDPDADRCAVAVPTIPGAAPGGVAASGSGPGSAWRVLTGDEVGALLGDQAAQRAAKHPTSEPGPGVPRLATAHPLAPPTLASSIVSSRLLARIAAAHGVEHRTTLTGFKWIARVPGLVFGYEEALGYCVDPAAVRDKDGIAAAVRVALLTEDLARRGCSLADALDAIALRHGLHATSQLSFRLQDRAQLEAAMSRLRAAPPRSLAGSAVTQAQDLARGATGLPPTDALVYETAAGDRAVVRPSGTEPKLKCYLEVIVQVVAGDVAAARSRADRRLTALRADCARALR